MQVENLGKIFMLKKSNKSKRKIYDKNYYKAQAILRDPWFIEKILWLKSRFKEVGCPVPTNGFKTYDQYQKWRDKYWDTRSEMYKDKKFITKQKEITSGKEEITPEVYDALKYFKDCYLPPVYGLIFREILEHFKIKTEDKKSYDFLERYIFLNKKEYPTTIISIKWIRNSKTDKMELFIPILGHTRREDIINNWDFISKEQKHFPDYLGKSKEWEEFDRDIEIFNLYKEIKRNGSEKGFKLIALDDEIYVQLHHKYKSLTVNKIRNIVTKTKKRLGE
jgi:hypothetical protein